MSYYVAVKMKYVGEMYTVSGPFDTFEEAEKDMDEFQAIVYDNLDEDEYLSVVKH